MQPGIVAKEPRDSRFDLEALPDQQLFDLSKNVDAVHRKLAAEVEALLATPPPGATD
jgi:hypothetical protein